MASEVAGRVASGLVHPAGSRVRSDHSLARSLVSRGRPEEARATLEAEIAADPTDPVPYLELARLCRDALQRPEDALSWFRRAVAANVLGQGDARVVIREIAELARRHLADAARAAPDLARHAEAFEGTEEGDWARDELARIKREMVERKKAEEGGTFP